MAKPAELFYAEAHAGGQELVALGVNEHFTNPAHPQFDVIGSIWRMRYLSRDPVKPIVVHEGYAAAFRSQSALQNPELAALKMGGEAWLIATMADKSNIPCLVTASDALNELRETLKATTEAGISPKLVNHYFAQRRALELRSNPELAAAPAPGAHSEYPAIEAFATDARSRLLGRKIVNLWERGHSPFVLYHNDFLMNSQAEAALEVLPNYQAESITLLPPASNYAALPQLAPASTM